MTLNRRTLLELTGAMAAASVGTTAGCLETVGLENDGDSEDDGEVPAYADWLRVDENGRVGFVYVDWEALEALDDSGPNPEANEESEEWQDHEDAMVAYPMLGAVIGVITASLGLWGTGLEGVVQPSTDEDADESTGADFETNVEEFIIVNEAIVLAGEIDAEEVDAELTTAPDDAFSMKSEYERTGEIGAFDRYERVEDDAMGPAVLAVNEEAIVFAVGDDDDTDAAEVVRGPIEAREGETAADENSDVEWLLEEAGHGQLVLGGYGEDLDEPVDDEPADEPVDNETADDEASVSDAEFAELEGLIGICSSLELEADGATGAFAAIDDDLPDEDELEDVLGTSAAEATLEVDDDRVTASATWEEDVTDQQV
ncbi:hypothetical protein [Natronococcus wangiae]|uniref:hypothetical protein n=1 Tax=Natronococcus wangiae TaxID=3068275 RepID=UPI00273FBA17|nr:hypothetical protein [Natronococcus sp. AD5]